MSVAGVNPYVLESTEANAGSKTRKDGGVARAQTLENLPADILSRLVPDESALALSRTSKTMRAAAHAASVGLVAEARPGHEFRNGQGLLAKLNTLPVLWTVTVLRLGACNLRAGGGAALATFVQGNTTLRELDVRSNYLQEAGGLALAAALRGNTTLTKLDLRRNVMGDRVGTEFARLLRLNSTLRCLNLGFNRLGATAVVEFAWALGLGAGRANATLTSLDLSGNELRGGGAMALARALRENTTLTELDLQSTHMGMDDVHALTAALYANTTLARLDLRYLPPIGELALTNVLFFNPQLGARVLAAPRA